MLIEAAFSPLGAARLAAARHARAVGQLWDRRFELVPCDESGTPQVGEAGETTVRYRDYAFPTRDVGCSAAIRAGGGDAITLAADFLTDPRVQSLLYGPAMPNAEYLRVVRSLRDVLAENSIQEAAVAPDCVAGDEYPRHDSSARSFLVAWTTIVPVAHSRLDAACRAFGSQFRDPLEEVAPQVKVLPCDSLGVPSQERPVGIDLMSALGRGVAKPSPRVSREGARGAALAFLIDRKTQEDLDRSGSMSNQYGFVVVALADRSFDAVPPLPTDEYGPGP
jgi:hypothetical protein